MDELSALIKTDSDYRNTSLICFTETWLSEVTVSNLDGFTFIRYDRDTKKTGKAIGGGLCMAVNDKWATNYTVRETDCSRHYEIMTVSFRPFYLPREFTQVTVILAYVPGPDNALAAERIADSYNNAVSRAADQPIFLLGDFNSCDVGSLLPHLEQYVTSPTRLERTLDLCFGNIPGAYVSKSLPPLGFSDHNVVLLLPKYRQRLKTHKILTKNIQVWNNDSVETLRGCFELTDWEMFFQSSEGDLDVTNDSICSYMSFCAGNVIPTKEIQLYPNNKPWVSKEMKHCINLKKLAFMEGDKSRFNELKRELRDKTRLAKRRFKDKMEERFIGGNTKVAWQNLNMMMGKTKASNSSSLSRSCFLCRAAEYFLCQV
jgi:hypothetical protein